MKAKVKARTEQKRVSRGDCIRVTGRVKPKKRFRAVTLQVRKRGGWRSFKRDTTNGRSRFAFPVCFDRAGKTKLRVRYSGKGDKDNVAGTSRTIRIRVTRR